MIDLDYDICRTQGRIFEIAAENGYDIEVFSEAFLHSDFCRRQFDTVYSRYQLAGAYESWDNFLPEIEDKLRKYPDDQVFDADVAGWIGFTYRQLWYQSKMPSSRLGEIIPPKEMIRLYPGYHTIDPDMAAEKITEIYHLEEQSQARPA